MHVYKYNFQQKPFPLKDPFHNLNKVNAEYIDEYHKYMYISKDYVSLDS